MEEVFEEEHPLHTWVNATTLVEPEFDPHDRAWAEGKLDDVPLLPEFETPPAPKRQKKAIGARVRSKQRGISIADLETIEEDNDDETPEPSDNLVYQTSNESTSKTCTPSEGFDHGGDVSSIPPPAPPPDPIVFTKEEDFPMLLKMSMMGVDKGRKHNKPQVNIMYGRGRKWHLNSKDKGKAKAKEHPKIWDTIPTSFLIDGIG
ncbi:hypothetical protein Taro_038232 [Colocasia esculenta]|uniref:Uncharacterized protein n=1 Tax=Colocasia esculenta TaxID=4460 RepID=A0A843WIL0_COLES|nr:hypothetical protein [Colocasia esculenta]